MTRVRIGTAGWTIPRDAASAFPAVGTSLERYGAVLGAAEINSSFHRPHRISTWERWRDTSPEGFRFSVKLPKTITHQRKLVDIAEPLDEFLAQAHALREKLAVLLVQLPPKLEFEREVAGAFFAALEERSKTPVACEPRNASWFTPDVDELLAGWSIARVAADPAICPPAARPGGFAGLRYWRLHGSPVIYRSSYSDRIAAYAEAIGVPGGAETWCIFDNTASSAALSDALALRRTLG